MGSSTENSAYGPTRNPWDPSRVPGGSGGGSAAAVAAGLAPWALGSDTGGSIKLPSAFCGNVGLRPTYGTVSRYGVVAFASSLDQVGPVDAHRARQRAPLPHHQRPRRERLDDRRRPAGRAARGRRPEGPAHRRAAAAQRRRGDRARRQGARSRRRSTLAASLGAEIGDCELPLSVEYGLPCYYLIAPAEASANLARYDGVRYGLRVDGDDFREMVMRTRHEGFGDEPKRRIMLGTYALSSGYYDAYYASAQKVRTRDQARARRALRALRRARLADLRDDRVPARREGGGPARDVPDRRAHDPVEHGRPAEPVDPVRPLRRPAGRPPADRPAVRREHALPRRRTRSSRRSASTPSRSGCGEALRRQRRRSSCRPSSASSARGRACSTDRVRSSSATSSSSSRPASASSG